MFDKLKRKLALISTEIEQLQVKDLESQKSRLDQEASAKLAELNNR